VIPVLDSIRRPYGLVAEDSEVWALVGICALYGALMVTLMAGYIRGMLGMF
jgi:hypothetical protein